MEKTEAEIKAGFVNQISGEWKQEMTVPRYDLPVFAVSIVRTLNAPPYFIATTRYHKNYDWRPDIDQAPYAENQWYYTASALNIDVKES